MLKSFFKGIASIKKTKFPFLVCLLLSSFPFLRCKKANVSSQTWKRISLDYTDQMRSIAFSDPQTGLIAGGIIISDSPQSPQSILLHTEDGGSNWLKDTCSIPKFVISSVTASAGAFYAIGSTENNGNEVYKSIDQGKTWQFLHAIQNGTIFFFDDQRGILANLATLNLTTDAGVNFNQVYSDNVGYAGFTILQFMDQLTGYAAGGASYDNLNYGMMAKTVDAGLNWEKVPAPAGNIMSFYFVNIKEGYCFNFPDSLYKTDDEGINWVLINDHLPNVIINSFFKSINQGYAIGGDDIYRTNDGGNSWIVEYKNPPSGGTSLRQLYHPPGSSILFATGNDGLLLKHELNQ